MATELAMKRVTAGLVPVDAWGEETLAQIPLGRIVTVQARQSRNLDHHRKFFALLHIVQSNSEQYDTIERLLVMLKIAMGHVETIITRKGETVYVPKSINFASMDQAEFERFYDKAVEIILTHIMPGMERPDLEQEVELMLS